MISLTNSRGCSQAAVLVMNAQANNRSLSCRSPGAGSRESVRSSQPVDVHIQLVACLRDQIQGAALAV